MRTTLLTLLGGAALVAGTAAAAPAAAPAHRVLVEQEAGRLLSTTGLKAEYVFRVKSSPFGGGGAIRDFVLARSTFPATGKAATVAYYGDGRLESSETIALGAPNVAGVGPVTGTGVCTSGTFKHQYETCTYKVTGSYSLQTGQMNLVLSGTYTPSRRADGGKP